MSICKKRRKVFLEGHKIQKREDDDQAVSSFIKLMLHDAIFLATCAAMTLPDKLQVGCSVQLALLTTF